MNKKKNAKETQNLNKIAAGGKSGTKINCGCCDKCQRCRVEYMGDGYKYPCHCTDCGNWYKPH